MISEIVDVGAKVEINLVSQKERAVKTGEELHNYKSQVCDVFDNGELELLMPIEAGRLVLLSLNLRYEFLIFTKGGLYRAVGEVKERYKTDNQYLVRAELKTPLSKFQRRQYFRLKCVIDMKYYNITKEQADMSDTKDVIASLQNDEFYSNQKRANIVDISGGGVRFISEEKNESNSHILMIILLDDGKEEKQYLIVGHVIQCVRMEASDVTDIKYENRVEYMIKDEKMQEEIIKFIFAEERKSRKNEK